MAQDFWLTSGWHLTERDDNGHLVPTADLLRAYFSREEVAPEEGSVLPSAPCMENCWKTRSPQL